MAILGAAAGGGGGAITNFPITFSSSTTWACPVVMEAYVFVIGGGGAGGGGEVTATFRCQGGAAGGCAVSKLTLAVQNYSIVIGAGGENQAITGSETPNDGADSTFDNSGGTAIDIMTGGGGDGGNSHATGDLSAFTGGTASGGTLMNNVGGGQPAVTTDGIVTAGGAVGLWETGRTGIPTTAAGNGYMSETVPSGTHPGIGRPYARTSSNNWFISPLNIQQSLYGSEAAPNSSLDIKFWRHMLPAGAPGEGGMTGQGPYTSGGNPYYWYGSVSPPLSGGNSMSNNYQYTTQGAASLGGGGGSTLGYHASAVVYSPAGGNGGVIIIPISLGS